MKEWSKYWKSSTQVRKQRKYRYNAPLHIKQKFIGSHLSEELIKKYKKRSIGIRKGDKVKILRGQFKKKIGIVNKVDLKKSRVLIDGVEQIKKDGSKSLYPIHPSNILIIDLSMGDKKRERILRNSKKSKEDKK